MDPSLPPSVRTPRTWCSVRLYCRTPAIEPADPGALRPAASGGDQCARHRRSPALQQLCGRILSHTALLVIPNHTGRPAVIGHRHQGGQGDTLPRSFGDEAGAQAVPAEISVQAG